MITDDMIKQAAKEYIAVLNENLPNKKDCTHQFSVRFERKMKRLIYNHKHPVLCRTLSAIASILFIILGISSLLAVSVEAREFLYKWIRQQNGYYFEYHYDGNTEIDEEKRYCLNYIPEGYSLMASEEIEGGEIYIYLSEAGSMLQFSYTSDTEKSLYLNTIDYTKKDVSVNDMKGIVYLAPNTSESNAIVWTSEKNNVIFYISAFLDMGELVELAESVAVY